MRLATYDDGSRDGHLVVVSRDLATATYATDVATRLQQALDDWNFLAPQLQALSAVLDQGRARHAFAFEPQRCRAPLPRCFRWIDHDADGAHCRPGDALHAWQQAVPAPAGAVPQAAPGLAAVTGDVEAGIGPAEAIDTVRLLLLVQGWTVPATPPEGAPEGEAAAAPRFLAVRCAPVAITPDELGEAWRSGVAQAALGGAAPGRRAASKAAAAPLRWPATRHFGTLVARAAAVAPLGAGSVLAWYRPAQESPAGADAWQALDARGASLFGPLAAAARPAVAAESESESEAVATPPAGEVAPDV